MRPGDQAAATILAMQNELTALGLLPPGDERDDSGRLTMPGPGPQPVQPCGTVAAYYRHRRHGEKPCADCKGANNTYRAELREGRAA